MIADRSTGAARPIGRTRAAVAAYVKTHRDASHRAIARVLSVSPSTVDRACRAWRDTSRQACPHGRGDAPRADAPDALTHATLGGDTPASPAASPEPGSDARWRATVVQLRPHQAEDDAPAPVPDAPNAISGDVPNAVSPAADQPGDPTSVLPRCPGCHYRQLQPVAVGKITNCEACGLGFVAEDEVPR